MCTVFIDSSKKNFNNTKLNINKDNYIYIHTYPTKKYLLSSSYLTYIRTLLKQVAKTSKEKKNKNKKTYHHAHEHKNYILSK